MLVLVLVLVLVLGESMEQMRELRVPWIIACALAASAVPGAAVAATPARLNRVPKLVGGFVASGYAQLRQDGFRITIPHGFTVSTLAGGGEIVSSAPGAGRWAPVGSVVSLTVGCRDCAEASPAVPTRTPAYRVPDFTGRSVSSVTRWVAGKTLYLSERFSPLDAAAAAQFAENFEVAHQLPAPGAALRLGVDRRTGPDSGSFTPTPLTVWLVQRR